MKTSSVIFWVSLIGIFIVLLGCFLVMGFPSDSNDEERDGRNTDPQNQMDSSDPEQELLIRQTRIALASEELLLELTPFLIRLSESVKNLDLPSHLGTGLFAEKVEYNDLTIGAKNEYQVSLNAPAFQSAAIHEGFQQTSGQNLSLWDSLIDKIDYFDSAKFYFVKSKFRDELQNDWEAVLGFEGHALTKEGQWQWMKARILTRWKPSLADDNILPRFKIAKWEVKKFKTLETRQKLFTESSGTAIRDSKLLKELRHCQHEEYIVQKAQQGTSFKPPHPHFFHIGWDRHPAVSVVDLDRDGFDDLYFLSRWGRNIFLHNKGDGTFEDITQELGLDIVDYSSCAIFADFDNDGDSDLILGRTLARSMYLENRDGHFIDRSNESLNNDWPAMVASISAADYNGDGLLDFYVSTYLASMENPLLRQFLDRKNYTRVMSEFEHRRRNLDRAGPPNVLIVNKGHGKFEIDTQNENLKIWCSTYQSTWGDFDNDGDPDLYIANDFATNNLFRNDRGIFVEITTETGTKDIGFGMGASWGDYDNDDFQDLYVTNMFSKAGRRLTSLPGVEKSYAQMARGNSLFRNVPNGEFERVSGLDPPSLTVEMAGWSWGGQFADFNNDGYLDIYALSGFYTAPKRIAMPGVDL